MDEHEIITRIDELINEEHHLRSGTEQARTTQGTGRLQELETALDQCWDLLRQRRARTHAGEDPGQAAPRPTSEVETYLQ